MGKNIGSAFPKVKNSVAFQKFPVGSFPNGKYIFPNSLMNSWNLAEEIEYLNHHVKFEMWPTLCKFSSYFQQWNLH